MRNRISRATLASTAGLPADAAETCQRILAMREDMHPWLSTNPELTPAVWHTLWGATRPEAGIAQGLVGRELDAAQRAVVIAKENRVGILRTFIASNRLTVEEQRLLSGKANAGAALIEQHWLDQALRKPVARKVGGLALLREMALAPDGLFSRAELDELVTTYHDWMSGGNEPRRGAKDRGRYLRILFGRHPALAATVLEAGLPDGRHLQDLLTAIAGSANLTADAARGLAAMDGDTCTLAPGAIDERHYCLIALVNNPRCPADVVNAIATAARWSAGLSSFQAAAERRIGKPDVTGPLEEISDPDTLARVVRRALPYRAEAGDRPARPVELLALAKNPNLTEQQHQAVVYAIAGHVERELVEQDDAVLDIVDPDRVGGLRNEPNRHTAAVPPAVKAALELAAEKLGTDPVRWETLIGLVDDYDGTFEELVALSESI